MAHAPLKCFWIEPTGRMRIWLRRYHPTDDANKCQGRKSYHDAMNFLEDVRDDGGDVKLDLRLIAHDDPRWPAKCECGYLFAPEDVWQHFRDSLYRRVDTGEEFPLREAKPGAMWDATWLHQFPHCCGPDGRCINVILPNGLHWCIDAKCSNCTRPSEPHKCWCRHGAPPKLTVDKHPESGETCSAGAGSIVAGDFHGFLRDGVLVSC